MLRRLQGRCSRCRHQTIQTGKLGQMVACKWGGCNGTVVLNRLI